MTELERAKELGQAALATLEANRRRIDDLNVYPVPDGDTGTNLTLTARAIMEVLDASTAADRATLAKELTRAALMGARGNSGVIFSQILRGAAEALGEAGLLDAATIRRAFRAASDAAYRAVRRPVEGTMLSVIRELAEEAEDPRNAALEPAALLKKLIERGEDALARTPDQLAVLREAGVVDAGGAGLLEIVRGVSAALSGEPIPGRAGRGGARGRPRRGPPGALRVPLLHRLRDRGRGARRRGARGPARRARRLAARRRRLDRAEDPRPHGRARAARSRSGRRSGRSRASRSRTCTSRPSSARSGSSSRSPTLALTLETGVVAVVPGAGNRRLFESYGAAKVIEGGQTMNPSTADIVAAIQATPATEVLVLPNNSNVILSAEQAAKLVDKQVRVIPSRSVPAGLAAIVRYLPSLSAEENEAAMLEALDQVATGEVTVASRDVELDGMDVRKGAWLGLADGAAVASSSDFDEVACAVAEKLLGDGREVLTLLTGEDEPDLAGLLRRLEELHPAVELDVQPGGQPHYPLLLSAE